MTRPARPGWIAPAIIVGVALALRVAYFTEIRSNPFFETPVFDAHDYLVWAEEIAGGNLVWDQLRLHSPGYPYVLALFSVLSGHRIGAMVFANSLLGCGWILLLTLALRRLLPRPAPEIAGALAAVYWVFLPFEAQLLAETLFTFLCVLALFLLVRARGARGLLAAGAALGLAAATRPNAVACAPFLALVVAWRSPPRFAVRRAGALLLAFAAVYAPVPIRNYQLSGMFTNGHHMAINLYIGNHLGAPGFADPRPGPEWDRLSAEPARLGGARTLADHERYFRDRVRQFVLDHPVAFARLQWKKLLMFLDAHEIRVVLSPYFLARWAPLQASPPLPGFGAMIPFAVLGLALAWRRGGRIGALYAFALPLSASVVLTIVGGRYRLPVLPFLIAFAGAGAERLLAWGRERRWGALGGGLAAAATVFAIAHRPVPDSGGDTFAEEWGNVAFVEEEYHHDLDAARSAWERALDEDPNRTATYEGAARFALRTGDLGAAAGISESGLARAPHDPELLRLRGRTFLLADRTDSAATYLDAALRESPDDAEARADLGRALYDLGRVDEAMEAFRESLRQDDKNVSVLLDASLVLHETALARKDDGLEAAAVGLLKRVLEREPGNAEAEARLAAWTAGGASENGSPD